MNQKLKISQLYNPIQPTLDGDKRDILYKEFVPDDNLQDFIYCYWQLKTNKRLEHTYHYKVVADGCIDIFFELDNPHNSYLMGFATGYTEFSLENSFNYVGIRFLPTSFTHLFGLAAHEITDRYEDLSTVLPQLAEYLANRFDSEKSFYEQKSILDEYFLIHVKNIDISFDVRIQQSLFNILSQKGNLQILSEIHSGISQRQLRRLFQHYVGGSPKMLSRIIRFQHAIKQIDTVKSTPPFYESGFYDQSHFIKEFNKLYGKSPSQVFKN